VDGTAGECLHILRPTPEVALGSDHQHGRGDGTSIEQPPSARLKKLSSIAPVGARKAGGLRVPESGSLAMAACW